MGRLAVLVLLLSPICFPQAAGTTIYRAVLLPASEVPAVNNLNARGIADVTIGVVRDASGQITAGTVDILARVTFPAAANAIGLGIWSGNAGQAGALTFNTALSAQSPYSIQPNGDSIHLAVQVTPDNTAGVGALRSLDLNPAAYYVNVLTSANPNGAMRGQLQRAQMVTLMALLSSDNVAPPAYPPGYGAALAIAIGTRDASGNWTSGEIYTSLSYSTQDSSTFNTLQLRIGSPGANGAVAFTATLPAGLAPPPNGAGSMGPYYTELSITTALQTGAFTNLFADPGALYVDLRTGGSPNGSLRGQLHATDSMPFPLLLRSDNEAGAASVTATAAVILTLSTLRNQDGSISAGVFLADLDYRFPAATQFLGLYLQPGAAGQAGPPALQVTSDFHSDTGFGNYFGWSLPFADSVSLATLNLLVANPAAYYADLHTVDIPGGAARAQLAQPSLATPGVTAIVSANLDPNATALVPGGLITIYGVNLAQVATGIAGWSGQTLPFTLNGVRLQIGGEPAPLLYVSAQQINAQVPADLAPSNASIVVSGPNGPIVTDSANVVAGAPAIFFFPAPAILRNSDFSPISAANPAKAGDVILVYATGMGQTNPPLLTGEVVPAGAIARTAPVTATIGGTPAGVIYSIASPSFPGLYQVAVRVPPGISGPSPLVLQEGAAVSNPVTLAMR